MKPTKPAAEAPAKSYKKEGERTGVGPIPGSTLYRTGATEGGI
jgi:hypothetical protein